MTTAKFTKKTLDEMVSLFDKGKSMTLLAAKYNCEVSTIAYHLKHHPKPILPPYCPHLYNIRSEYVAPIAEQLLSEPYGDLKYDDANVNPGRKNYTSYNKHREDDPKKYDRGPLFREMGDRVAKGIKLPFFKKI